MAINSIFMGPLRVIAAVFYGLFNFVRLLERISRPLLCVAAVILAIGLVVQIIKRGLSGSRLLGIIIALVTAATEWFMHINRGEVVVGWYYYREFRFMLFLLPRLILIGMMFLSIDLIVKVFLTKEGLDGGVDFKEDMEVLKAYKAMRAEEKTEKRAKETKAATAGNAFAGAAATGVPAARVPSATDAYGESYYDGSGLGILGINLVSPLITGITCGIAFPWMLVWKKSYIVNHTVVGGRRLTFTGTGGQLFGNWIKWLLLSVITCGIYSLWVYRDLLRWEDKHTEFADGGIYAGESRFDGSAAESIGIQFLTALLVTVTCGIATPWAVTMRLQFERKNQVVNGQYLKYEGTGGGLFGTWLLNALLTVVTCGIYYSWMECAILRYEVKHTYVNLPIC